MNRLLREGGRKEGRERLEKRGERGDRREKRGEERPGTEALSCQRMVNIIVKDFCIEKKKEKRKGKKGYLTLNTACNPCCVIQVNLQTQEKKDKDIIL